MRIILCDKPEDVASYGARLMSQQIKNKPDSVLGLATGSTPIKMYQHVIEQVKKGDLSLAACRSFNLDEYIGLTPDHSQSYRYFMQQNFFNQVDIAVENTFVPDGFADDIEASCVDYESKIQQSGGIDWQLLGIGVNGHIGFNEPGSSLRSRTRVKTLSSQTIEDNARFFSADEFQPQLAITVGIETIMQARDIVLLATGSAKAAAVKATAEGPVSASCPASILQFHPNVKLIVDAEAGQDLEHKQFYLRIEEETQKLMRY
ncbi:glucosamine-6-phosphate deaminase [Marinomonas sp. THO17]|uniref:glucosamine-6-phosphate deaminase n=1 Tax=Marinomonas sp. THO17 TaxID=3149048 RepID=UPI00336C056C